jgi:glycosyltransferase involved in cell wall biosynthesis
MHFRPAERQPRTNEMLAMKLSAVIPVYNEEESLAALYEEIRQVMSDADHNYEIIFVDDGSTDGSWDVIRCLAEADESVEGIRFRRNFGKAAALQAGFKASQGEIVFTLDGDLQDDPSEIPRFLTELEEGGLDVVSGWKKVRHDPWHKVLPSRVFNWMVSRLTGVRLHDHNCGFKCYRRSVVEEVQLYGELHRFVPVLAASRGWSVGEIEINHRQRQFGKSKYGVRRIVKGFLDLITVYLFTGFRQRPHHLLGTFGLFSLGLGVMGLAALTIWRILSHQLISLDPIHLTDKASFYYCILFILFGGQLVTMGILAEMVTAHTSNPDDAYSVSARTDISGHESDSQTLSGDQADGNAADG